MAFGVSPGVYVRELDLSQVVRGVATAVAGIVGFSTKGNVDAPVLITSPEQFVKQYGERVLGNPFHYSALAFLQRGNRLYVMRVHNGALYGGVEIHHGTGANAAFTAGMADPTNLTANPFPATGLIRIYGVNPGVWNNETGVRITNIDTANHEFDIEVYSTRTGVEELVETWTVSRIKKVDGYGRQMYLEDRINKFSDYIKVLDNTAVAETTLPLEQLTTLMLAGGGDGVAVTDTQINAGWDKFANPEDIDVRILINAGYTSVAVQQKMRDIAEARRDCVAILDMPEAQLSSVTDMVTWRGTTQNFNSSYTALYSPWVRDYDAWNDTIVDLPPSGYVAAQYAFNDAVGEPWHAPMGFQRGLLNVLGVTNVFSKGERDTLYENQINPIQMFRGEGVPLWGQKLQLTRPSALDRLNVRRLLIIIEKSCAIFLRQFIGETNTPLLRMRVRASIEDFLDLLAARGAFQIEEGDRGFLVQCDEVNNPPAVIDRNELHCYVFIKPIRVVEFIKLGIIVTATGVQFEELLARGVAL